ncbi:MAG: hypothetical protein Tsb0017_19210 [Geothermobacteraceae bacterium]
MTGRLARKVRCLLPAVLMLLGLLGGSCFAAPGDAERGALLFSGGKRMSNGGAPCLACHGFAVAGFGAAAAANFAPDLSGLYEDYGEEGVAGILESLPFPSMIPIYAKRPLTPQEAADLGAFFATAKTGSLPGAGTLAVIVAAGIIVFVGLIGLLGRRRLRAVRRPLVEQSRNRGGSRP